MNEHAEFNLLDEYVLGTLDAAAAEGVTGHLATCAACRAECDELRSVIDVLPHALPVAPARPALRDRIFAALDAPTPSSAPAPRAVPPVASPAARWRPSGALVAGLAAALLLALAGDALFATRAARPTAVANLPTTAPSAAATASAVPSRMPAPPPPASAPPTTVPATPDGRALAQVARLERALHAAQSTLTAETARIRRLETALATARAKPRVVTVVITPPPTGVPPTAAPPTAAPPGEAELVAALRTGKVYTIDGAVGNEPWHLTIVQPRAGAHALLYSGTPDAPGGETYRSWVVRGGRTVSLGELPPGKPATIEMPMALQAGDVVAFSREPIGSGDMPTTKFLMELTIPQ